MTTGTLKLSSALNAQSELYRALFNYTARHFSLDMSLDEGYFFQRLNCEGEKFCYIALPLLGKAIESSVITLEPLQVPLGWRLKRGSRLPLFLNRLFTELFEDDGTCRWHMAGDPPPETAHAALKVLRQFCLLYSKVDGPITDTEGPLQAFKERLLSKPTISLDSDILNLARFMIRRLVESNSPECQELHDFEQQPWGRHGPGAVSEGEKGPCKWDFTKRPNVPDSLYNVNERVGIPCRNAGGMGTARATLVPKDFRGPRIICIEPKEYQFAQQGLMDILYRLMMRDPITRRAIDFKSVESNRASCYDYSESTIDLKDASDRISLSLARLLLPRWFFKLVCRYRSPFIKVGEEILAPRCLATMGNATCFPLETLVFWAIAQSTVTIVRGTFPQRVQKNLTGYVKVFGDDIIVPLWACEAVCENLAKAGLVVNSTKTCSFSLVRESCGEWVFDGKPVRLLRVRSAQVINHRSWLQYSDYYRECDIPELQQCIRDQMDQFLPESSIKTRFNRNLQRSEVFLPSIVKRGRKVKLDDAVGLYSYFVENDLTPFLNGTRDVVKMRWVSERTYVFR